MKEYLILGNGARYELRPNGVKTATGGLRIEIIKPEGENLEGIRDVFKNKENISVLKVVNEAGVTLRIDEGYVCLGSRIVLDERAAVGVEVTEVETEDGVEVTTASETIYAPVVSLELFKETMESKVEANRADIDYLLMMEECANE